MPQTRSTVPDADHGVVGGLTVVRARSRRGPLLLRVAGEVDMLTVRRLGDALDDVLVSVAGDPDPVVVCDLDGVTFLGASGVDVVADAQRKALAQGVQLVLVARHSAVLRPFRLAELDGRLTVTDGHPALGSRAAVPVAAR